MTTITVTTVDTESLVDKTQHTDKNRDTGRKDIAAKTLKYQDIYSIYAFKLSTRSYNKIQRDSKLFRL